MPIEAWLALAARSFAQQLGGKAGEQLLNVSGRALRKRSDEIQDLVGEPVVMHALRGHVCEANNWSSVVDFFGMPAPEPVGRATTALTLAIIPRKFRRPGRSPLVTDLLDECDILRDNSHYLLLGDPGAGKTTTLKRLTRHLLDVAPTDVRDRWEVPLTIVLREHRRTTSITQIILERLGLDGAVAALLNPSPVGSGPPTWNDDAGEHLDVRELRFVALLLNTFRVVLFVDGLDEVHPDTRRPLEDSVERLARMVTDAKIIVSCRSGDFRRNLDGFSRAEIAPLARDKIKEVAGLWLGRDKAEEFLGEIDGGAAYDLADRPLFLCQMLTLFRNMEGIPDQPSSLCRQMVRLMLQDWDSQRGVVRKSRYSRFGVDTKLEFLTSLAYIATFQMRRQHFDRQDLIHAYARIHADFGLPEGEDREVASELETHTGILVQAGHDGVEFAHLSIQEYLAAEYLVRLPHDLKGTFVRSPAATAVAVALSSDPSFFLASLAAADPFRFAAPDDLAAVSFTSRLLQERPRFRDTDFLGAGALHLMDAFDAGPRQEAAIDALVSCPPIGSALTRVLRDHYDARDVTMGRWPARRRPDGGNPRIRSMLPADAELSSYAGETVAALLARPA